jgi:two-component system sensor histidine kinase NreB
MSELEKSVELRVVAAQDRERARIARELHDVVGQALLAVRLNLVGLGRHSNGDGSAIQESLEIVDAALAQVRTAAFELRPAVLDEAGFATATRELCREISRRSGIPIDCRVDVDGAHLPRAIETACFRILQEALTNAVRHAQAHRIRVRLGVRRRTGRLVLEVCDCGVGFDMSACNRGGCFGLTAMRERAALVGGTVDIRSAPGDGTTVTASFGISQHARSAA